MSLHKDLIGRENIHVPHDIEYADEAARVGDTTLQSADIKKLALQLNDFSLWMLQDTTPTWISVSSGIGALPFDAINDPAVYVAVTQAIIDANRGTVITLTSAGANQTLAAPTLTIPRNFIVMNNDTSTDGILVNGSNIPAGNYLEFYWDGTVWILEVGGSGAGTPGGSPNTIQYNNSGAFGGDDNHTWDDVEKKETVIGDIEQTGGTPALLYDPIIVSTTPLGAGPRYSVALANYLYIVDNNAEDLKIFDVTDPAVPFQVGVLGGVGSARGCDIAGRFVYISDSGNGGQLHIVDVLDKSNPVLVSTTVTGGTLRGIKVSGTTVFMTGNGAAAALISVDVTDVNAPIVLDTYVHPVGGLRTEFDVVGTIAYTVSNAASNNFQLLDVSDPTNITELASLDIGLSSANWSVQVQGRYAYLGTEDGDELRVYDVSDPVNTSITPVGSVFLDTNASPRAVNVSGNFAYVVDAFNNALYVIDISDPTNPVQISNPLTIGQNPVSISTIGRFAYITDNTDDNFVIVDLGGIQAQNLNVGNIDAGNVNVRRDIKAGGNLSANAGLFGAGGLSSSGPAKFTILQEKTHRVALKPDKVEFIYTIDDFPLNGNVVQPVSGTRYIIMAPIITSDHTIQPPAPNNFSETVIESSNKQNNTWTNTGTGSAFVDTDDMGGLRFVNIRFINTGSRVFADIEATTRTNGELILDNSNVLGFDTGTLFTNTIVNMRNGCFISDSGTFTLIDSESNVVDCFLANFGNPVEPNFEIFNSDGSAIPCIFTAKNNRWSANSNEAFIMIHTNIIDGSTIELLDNKPSIFTAQTAPFFGLFTGNITAVDDSAFESGVKTLITSPLHDVKEGDTVVQSGFVTQTALNGTFIASNVTTNGYDVVHVFTGATDTGSWVINSIDETDIKVFLSRNEDQKDSKSIGGFHVNDNAVLTAIALTDTFQDVDLGTVLAASNIEEWELTDAASGELTYRGLKKFEGTLKATFNGTSASGTNLYKFSVAVNGAIPANSPEAPLEAKATIVGTTLLAPVSVNTGDTVTIQIKGVGTSTNVTISDASVSVL